MLDRASRRRGRLVRLERRRRAYDDVVDQGLAITVVVSIAALAMVWARVLVCCALSGVLLVRRIVCLRA